MLPTTRQHAGRCIYCAFRARQLLLQQSRRSKHTSREHQPDHSPLSAFTSKEPANSRFRRLVGADFDHRKLKRVAARSAKDGELGGVLSKDANQLRITFPHNISRSDFRDVLYKRLGEMKNELRDAPVLEQLRKEHREYRDSGEGKDKVESFNKLWKGFAQTLLSPEGGERKIPFFGESDATSATEEKKRLMHDLREAFGTRGVNGLDDRIKYAFYGHVTGSRFTTSDIHNQRTLADLRYPSEWFPATRTMHRTMHLHVGPTNSGKTYHALQRLEQAETGIYAGPLRLLAHEVYTRMNARGKACSLITGEERRAAPGTGEDGASSPDDDALGNMSACTVEMMPLNKTFDVAVIDEIQMIGSTERGWAWTQALLGVKAREVHLCGEERTVPLVRELCASLGEKLEIHRYERLSPLRVADESLGGDLKKLRRGDCIVSFSVMGIHALRRQVERATGKKVATVYGSLPPETRAQQARLFNEPDNDYDFLVASDAVGMGLNLAIKRIIFESSSKFDGLRRRTLHVADIKQIAGRAGRYRVAEQAAQQPVSEQELSAVKGDSAPFSLLSASPPPPPPSPSQAAQQASPSTLTNETAGLVTTLETFDYPIIANAMTASPEPIQTAGLFPPSPVLERFASYFPPGTPFSYILTRLHELSQTHSRFHLCNLKEQLWMADLIEPITGLTITDRNIICSCPASKADMELWRELVPAFAKCIAEQTGGNIVDIAALPLEVLEADVGASREFLRDLERLHKGVVAYLWLSFRFAGIFGTRALAMYVKGLVEEKIEWVLGQFSFEEGEGRRIAARRERALMRELEAVGGEVVVGVDGESGVGGTGVVVGDSEDGDEEEEEVVVRSEGALEQQTTLTSGGDRFGSERLDLPDGEFEPAMEEADVEIATNNDENSESDAETAMPLSGAAADGKEAESFAARRRDKLFETASNKERPTIGGVELASSTSSAVATDTLFSAEEGDSDNLEIALTRESGLSENEQPLPETQQLPPPQTTEERVTEDASPPASTSASQSAGRSQFGGSAPPKHLAHLDVHASPEVERDVGTRP